MGAKFYRGADKPKKIRKRLMQTRSWFRTYKWVAYHAHPRDVPGHPFKGGFTFSTGQLLNPEIKRFALWSSVYFKPPMPGYTPGDELSQQQQSAIPSFSDFFRAYFGERSYNLSNEGCFKMMQNLKKCHANNGEQAEQACAFYLDGFKRLACTA